MAVAVHSTFLPVGLRQDLSIDRSQLMKEAVRLARWEAEAYARQFPGERLAWGEAMRFGLRRAWSAVRSARDHRRWLSARDTEKARLEGLAPREQRRAGLEQALVEADFIDSTVEMIRCKAAITRELAALPH